MDRIGRIAVFDLDGTLTRHDTYLPYLIGFLARHPWRIYRLLHLPWVVGMFYLGRLANARLKEYFLWAFLGGISDAVLQRWTKAFVDRLLVNGMRREAIVTLERHRQAGDLLVLLSASLDIYVDELGKRLGFDQVVCTATDWCGDRLSGRLSGGNCYGEEKARRLETFRKAYGGVQMVAYADQESDLPLLRLADEGVLINGSVKARCLAAQVGVSCRTWKDPRPVKRTPTSPTRWNRED